VVIGSAGSSCVKIDGSNASYGGEIYASTGSVTVDGADIEISGNNNTSHTSANSGVTIARTSSADPDPLAAGNDGQVAEATPQSSLNTRAPDDGYGGAIYAALDVVIGSADSVFALSNNTAAFGGAVIAFGDIALTGSGTLSSNTATTGSGGAIYAGGSLTLDATATDGITFTGNTAGGQPNAIFLDNTAAGNVVALHATNGDIVLQDPISSTAINLSAVTVNGPQAVIFDGSKNANISPVYATTTVAPGATFVVENSASYGAPAGSATGGPTRFTVASGATLAGGGAGTVSADAFTLGSGTLDISGSSSVVGNPAGSAAGGFSAFNISASSAGGISLSGGTVRFNLCGNRQLSDVLNLSANGGAITPGATLAITQVSGCTGAGTSGNGILLVRSDSATTDPLFVDAGNNPLPSGSTVTVSGYAYTLKLVGDNWYLQSSSGGGSGSASPIPALGQTALALLALLLGGGAALALRRKP
jgi:predicted outer membrane repeat protein